MKRAISTPTTLSPSRRSLLASTPLAALFALAPHATLGEMQADRELIDACNQYFNIDRHFVSYGDRDIDPNDKALEELFVVTDRIAQLRAATLEGAKSRAAVIVCHTPCVMHDDAFAPESAEMIKALLRDLLAAGEVA